jgi:hypothetical protein
MAMSQALNVQAFAKFARSKTGRVLVETYNERVPKLRSTIFRFQRACIQLGEHHYRDWQTLRHNDFWPGRESKLGQGAREKSR